MGRLMLIAVLVALTAGAITIAVGGVDEREARSAPSESIASADHRDRDAAERAPVGATVGMRALAFTRPRINVSAGERVTFANRDDVEHTVYATLGAQSGVVDFNSSRIAPGRDYTTSVLAQPGTYSYVCTLHPTVMRGVIEVTG